MLQEVTSQIMQITELAWFSPAIHFSKKTAGDSQQIFQSTSIQKYGIRCQPAKVTPSSSNQRIKVRQKMIRRHFITVFTLAQTYQTVFIQGYQFNTMQLLILSYQMTFYYPSAPITAIMPPPNEHAPQPKMAAHAQSPSLPKHRYAMATISLVGPIPPLRPPQNTTQATVFLFLPTRSSMQSGKSKPEPSLYLLTATTALGHQLTKPVMS